MQEKMMVSPKVTVCVVCYNQEQFIAQCLQSIVDQVTDFSFDVLVSDDCSKDNTRAVIEDFAERYPEIIKPLWREKNLGAYQNFLQTHQTAVAGSALYICHCDGDDYWLPGKLQAQADYLDQHDDCNVTFTRTYVLYGESNLVQDNIRIENMPIRKFYRGDVIRLISIGTNSSKMYRRPKHAVQYPDIPILDYFETIEQVGTGYASYVSNEIYSVYRANIGIATQGLSTRYALHQTFLYLARRYPKQRLDVNTASLCLFLADFKNRRPSWKAGFYTFIQTFHPAVFIHFLKTLKYLKVLRNPGAE